MADKQNCNSRGGRHVAWFVLLIIVVALVLSGCSLRRSFTPEVHKVRKGESLSMIAAEYGLDWHKLARWNHIKPPYTIYVGQRLSLDPFPPLNYGKMRQQRETADARRHPDKRSTVSTINRNQRFSVSEQPSSKPQQTTAKTAPTSSKPTTGAPVGSETNEEGKRHKQTQPLVNHGGWRWPLANAVLASDNIQPARHGIDIDGVEGTPIYAAHDGQVVYSGAGLQGIGQLVIVQHGGQYLSAYGYVKNRHVEEGDRITAGQHIADMGMGPGSRAELHFEIRHKGDPIKPQSVLPAL